MTVRLPDHPVAVGERWSFPHELWTCRIPGGGNRKVKAEQTLHAPQREDGRGHDRCRNANPHADPRSGARIAIDPVRNHRHRAAGHRRRPYPRLSERKSTRACSASAARPAVFVTQAAPPSNSCRASRGRPWPQIELWSRNSFSVPRGCWGRRRCRSCCSRSRSSGRATPIAPARGDAGGGATHYLRSGRRGTGQHRPRRQAPPRPPLIRRRPWPTSSASTFRPTGSSTAGRGFRRAWRSCNSKAIVCPWSAAQPPATWPALTYYFNAQQQLQRITFHGTTGDTRNLVALLTGRFQFARRLTNDPGLFIYKGPRSGGVPKGQVEIRSARHGQTRPISIGDSTSNSCSSGRRRPLTTLAGSVSKR